MVMATTAASSAGSAVASAIPQVAKQVASQLRPAHWVKGMPTRTIAQVLLRQENEMMDHLVLYEETNKLGLLRSRRHFKHCLRMLKDQKRVAVICNGPVHPGSAKRAFKVKLTRRGSRIYTGYSKMPLPENDGNDGERGLKDALV